MFRFVSPITAVLLSLASLPAMALTRTQITDQSVLNSVPNIEVPTGHSIVIHLENGQKIQSIWVDDPSFVGIATDKPLCGQSTGGGCGYASAVRITQLSGGLNLPGVNFPDSNAINTLLTIGTTDSSGSNPVFYQFQVALTGRSNAGSSLISITPQLEQDIVNGATVSRDIPLNVTRIARGADIAKERGIADLDSEAWERLENFLEVMGEDEMSIAQGILDTQVSRDLLTELNKLGVSELAEI